MQPVTWTQLLVHAPKWVLGFTSDCFVGAEQAYCKMLDTARMDLHGLPVVQSSVGQAGDTIGSVRELRTAPRQPPRPPTIVEPTGPNGEFTKEDLLRMAREV
jgi:hypothetical protein